MTSVLHLTKTEQVQVDAAAEVLRPWGLEWSVEMGGKHVMMKVAGPKGGEWKITIACTPRSADHARDHARQKAKRLVNEINRRLGVFG